MSVNNADESHSAHSWADAHPISQAIYFDGDEHPRVATVGAPFVLYIVRRDAPSAVGGIGRVKAPWSGARPVSGEQRPHASSR
jgi:uncharacterized protein (UPF0261 family)